jgi:hypothetical protein
MTVATNLKVSQAIPVDTTALICPLLSIGLHFKHTQKVKNEKVTGVVLWNCTKDRCAWWIGKPYNECAVKTMAFGMSGK